MTRRWAYFVVAALVVGTPASNVARVAAQAAVESAPASDERVDTAAISRIRAEGLERSQVMDTAFWLTDRYGPRLSGSVEFEEAGEWTMTRLRSIGAVNVRKERFAAGPGWSLNRFHATMTAPRVMPIIAMPKAWSAGTRGTVTAAVVRVAIANEADAARYRGRLRDKIVLAQTARPVRMLEYGDGPVVRYGDQDGKWAREAMTPGAPAAAAPVTATTTATPSRTAAFDVMQFFKEEGVVAVFDRGRTSDLASGGSGLSWLQQHVDGGTIVLEDRAVPRANPSTGVPQVTLAVEHYNRLVRLLEHDVPVTVELNIGVTFRPETQPTGFNIVGELPGTDKSNEIVLLGAHFDSWHGATGATDNAAGVAAMIEALRIIRAAGLTPRRTIRIGLWGSEESGPWNGPDTGLVGSRVHVSEHLGTRDNPRPELGRTAAYFNLDNGTGRIRGVWTEGNAAAARVFDAWSRPLKDLGVDLISPRSVQQTDHVSFAAAGVPAFQFVQERYEYNSRTHHTNMDVYDRLQPDDLKQIATVAAVFAWHAATRDDLLPRVTALARGGR
jgi:hypothetical protein